MKRPLVFVLGVTGDMGFAAACVVLSINRHMSVSTYDILILEQGLPVQDTKIVNLMPHCSIRTYTTPSYLLNSQAKSRYSLLCLSKFEIFRLLDRYKTAVWLDADIAIQDDLSDIMSYGPMGLALEDPAYINTMKGGDEKNQRLLLAGANFLKADPCYDMMRPNFNSGVVVVRDDLPYPEKIYNWCSEYLLRWGENLRYPDQAVFNMAAQQFSDKFTVLPYTRFNAHPRNAASLTAAVVHAFGDEKFWNNGIAACSFPEWQRDYLRWLALGGSPYTGPVDNEELLNRGIFNVVGTLYNNLNDATSLMQDQHRKYEKMRKELSRTTDTPARERAIRFRLETALQAKEGIQKG